MPLFAGRKHQMAYIRRHEVSADATKPTVPPQTLAPVFGADLPAAERVEKTLAAMTPEEKITMLGGVDYMGVHGVARLGLRRVWCSDASAGVRNFGPGTAFPAPIALAASWNRGLVERAAAAIAGECRAVGVSILLGPGVNIARVPTCGRKFEYLGEDPFLASELVAAYIRGVQGGGVAAAVKHFACNHSDYDRHRMNAIVDERTLHEIYFPAFRAAVRAGVKCVMTSYNPVNGAYASENRGLLRGEWGFGGIVMSDWNSVYSTRGPLEAGLDLEMPRDVFYGREPVERLIREGTVSAELVDEKVRRILGVFYAGGFFDRPAIDPSAAVRSEAHLAVALEAAREAVVLLKNERAVLPLDSEALRRVVLVGRNASATPTGGGGSSRVRAARPVSVEQALRQALPQAEIAVVADRRGRISRSEARLLARVDAVAETLIGANNPSGKLPFTMARRWADHRAAAHYVRHPERTTARLTLGPRARRMINAWPAARLERLPPQMREVRYEEGLLVGYRHFDSAGVEPRFAFGHGLSCTGFELSEPRLSAPRIRRGEEVVVAVSVRNTGTRAGAEVLQVYVEDVECSVERPRKELKAFEKVALAPGEARMVELRLAEEAFSFYDAGRRLWTVEPGKFRLHVGAGSRAIRGTVELEWVG